MEGVLVDTSVLVEAERERRDARSLRPLASAVSVISVSELIHGARRADSPQRRARRESFVESVVTWLPVMDFDLMVARRYAALWADTAAAGIAIGAHDLMIAATAQLLDLPVWTRDSKDFSRIPGIRLIDVPR